MLSGFLRFAKHPQCCMQMWAGLSLISRMNLSYACRLELLQFCHQEPLRMINSSRQLTRSYPSGSADFTNARHFLWLTRVLIYHHTILLAAWLSNWRVVQSARLKFICFWDYTSYVMVWSQKIGEPEDALWLQTFNFIASHIKNPNNFQLYC